MTVFTLAIKPLERHDDLRDCQQQPTLSSLIMDVISTAIILFFISLFYNVAAETSSYY